MSAPTQPDPKPPPLAAPAPLGRTTASSIIGLYGLGHLAVDAACAAILYGIIRTDHASADTAWTLVLIYNLLAFGTQAFLGSIVDTLHAPRLSAVLGCALTAGATPAAPFSPLLAVCIAGIGNSLFHVGGGAICLTIAPGRAAPAGLFVAPGAVGLALGMSSTAARPGTTWPWAAALLILGAVMLLRPSPRSDCGSHPLDETDRTPPVARNWLRAALLLLMFVIAVRAVCGTTIAGAWKGHATTPLLLATTTALFGEELARIATVQAMSLLFATTAALGKGLGGLVADRLGWLRVTLIAVLACIPLIPAVANTAWLALAAMLLLQATTGVTLAAISRLFPARPAFAFGLTSLAVLIGSVPSIGHWQPAFSTRTPTTLLLLASAAALAIALRGRRCENS
jgi:FSR family fosmidomycin resistance protein-like MFS transporter